MNIELIHIGFGNILAMNRIVAVASPNSAPTRRIMKEGKNRGLLIDMTNGRKTKAVIFTDSGHIVLAALAPETIANRIQKSWDRLAIKPEEGLPGEKLMQQSKTRGLLIDMTGGKKTQAVVFSDNGQIILAAVAPETINTRLPLAKGAPLSEQAE
jgi:regulator of extracellular matrix RemA (YlzA/DUF370 family)